MALAAKYKSCKHFKKKMQQSPLNEELRSSLTKNFRVLPLYEKALSDHTFSRNHSLKNNEYLRCRWYEYQRIHAAGKPEPFNFPHVNDYHYYNHNTCYKPELSISSKTDNRYKLRMGPGVDKFGEMPIPTDVGCRDSGNSSCGKSVMVHKNKKGKKQKK